MTTGGTGETGLAFALSELASRVQRGRGHDEILRIIGDGVVRLGLRCLVFQIDGEALVLRSLATTPERLESVERIVKRRLIGLRAPLARVAPATELLSHRAVVHRNDTELFIRFIEAATGRTALALDASTVAKGVIAPIYVRDQAWGLLSLVSSAPLRPEDAAVLALFATQAASMLEVAELVETLQRSHEELLAREQLASIGELAATVAHEIRNPLGVLFNSVTSLRRMLPAEVEPAQASDADTLLSIVSEETERLNEIVTDLLEVVRPFAMRTQEASLAKVIRTVVKDVPRLPDGSRVEVRLELADLPPVEIDARMIRQALLNLVINAFQAMPHGGTLRVETRMEHRDEVSYACVDISDNGAVEPKELPHVLPLDTESANTGTGLGLAFVKRVVEAHNGELELFSDEAGSTFTLRIPIPQWDDSHVSFKREGATLRPLRVVGTGR
jgi:two-component system sensor histidine kinase HydH